MIRGQKYPKHLLVRGYKAIELEPNTILTIKQATLHRCPGGSDSNFKLVVKWEGKWMSLCTLIKGSCEQALLGASFGSDEKFVLEFMVVDSADNAKQTEFCLFGEVELLPKVENSLVVRGETNYDDYPGDYDDDYGDDDGDGDGYVWDDYGSSGSESYFDHSDEQDESSDDPDGMFESTSDGEEGDSSEDDDSSGGVPRTNVKIEVLSTDDELHSHQKRKRNDKSSQREGVKGGKVKKPKVEQENDKSSAAKKSKKGKK